MVLFEKNVKKFGNLKYFCYICITKVFKTTIKNISKKSWNKFGSFKNFCYICIVKVLWNNAFGSLDQMVRAADVVIWGVGAIG